MADWSKYNKIDAKALSAEAENLGSGDFEELPLGQYEVALEDLELKPTKTKGDPMLVMTFRVVAGEFKKRKLWVNQVIIMGDENDRYRLHGANVLLRGLESGLEVKFEGVQEYSDLIDEILTKCRDAEYLLEIKERKGYRQYVIKERYTD